ncbi:hypothetical protein CY0110_17192 [Crocosphaera chwakensis CCY0110]|uniref:Uncharacterized protein n=1 Tax=Crocosphaera chwakensis CCY0110 TaxID=391612 RepID=A3IIC0_9CHRO|nr:hypothetical protein CY0110_17192 [Crocosphaera chwakensis CCY0110]
MPYCKTAGNVSHQLAAITPEETTTINTPNNSNQMTLNSAIKD